jgi:cell division protein FtsI (penicillin-binding protein 3)
VSPPVGNGQPDDRVRIDRVGLALLACVTGLFVVVLARVAQLQMAPPAALGDFIDDRVTTRTDLAPRGDLLDRRGRLIAATRTGERLFIDPLRFPQPYDLSIMRLSKEVGLDPDMVGRRLVPKLVENERRIQAGEAPLRYVSIGGVIDDARAEAARALAMPGVHLERRSVRETPGGDLVAPIAGKVGVDHDGLLGAEWSFEERLEPEHGALRYIHDARGRALWIEAGGLVPPHRGDSVRLSVDLAIQEIATEELARGMADADAQGGRVIIADPSTGEILAMADLVREASGTIPDDPARRRELIEAGARFEVLRPDPGRAVHPALGRNRCVEDVYEPGSTFKPFMWAAATELNLVRPEEVIDTEGGRWRTPYGRLIEDVVDRDEQTWREVLVNSSNIGMVKITDRMTDRQMQLAIRKFGFGARTNVGLAGEAVGLVTDAKDWTKYTRTSVAFGYEVAVTPVQMVRAFSAFARADRFAGALPRLRLVAATERELTADPVVRVIPDWVAHLARESMRGVAETMDNRLLREGVIETEPQYSMFGKSGTAEIASPYGRGYLENQHVSSFIAGAPAEDPRIVVLVIIDDPSPDLVRRDRHFGSWTAGPVVRRITDRTLAYMGVAPSADPLGKERAKRAQASAVAD